MKNDKLNEAFDNIDGKYVSMTQKAPGRSRALRLAFIAAALALLVAAISVITVMSRRNDIQNTGEDKDSASAPSDEQFAENVTGESTGKVAENVTEESTDNVAEIIPAADTTERVHEVFSGGPGDYSGAKFISLADTSKNSGTVYGSSQYEAMQDYRENAKKLSGFFDALTGKMLDGENSGVVSPVNVYMALSLLAECTGGESRKQILDVIGASSIEELREQSKLLWLFNSRDNECGRSLLGNSVWLSSDLPVKENCVDILKNYHFASSFTGDFSDEKYKNALRQWLSDQTNGLLDDSINDLEIPDETVASLASTLYYKAKWFRGYYQAENGVFKGAGGESECVFNKKTVSNAYIYEGSGFTAFRDGLSDGNVIWFFLPDDGKTVSDVIKTDLVSYVNGSRDGKRYDVTVRMPDFDVNFNSSIKETMKDLGITYCIEPGKADFSSLSDDDLYVSSAVHAARFKADKEGVEGAAYTVIMVEATGEPVDLPDYDLTLDRPFAFMVENNGVPLFTGCVCGLD